MTDKRLVPIDINEAFKEGSFVNAEDERLQEWLIHLSSQLSSSREIIRALTIHHIQLRRHISRLNTRNTILQWVIIVLAVCSIVTGIIQAYTTLKYSKEPPSYSAQQEPPKPEAAKSKSFQGEKPKEGQNKTPYKPLSIEKK